MSIPLGVDAARLLWYRRARDPMLHSSNRSVSALLLAIATFGVACGGQNAALQLAKPPVYQPEGQTKCQIRSGQSRPLIVEWPSPDRGALEAQAKKGLVAVRYVGCEMEVLRQCKGPGAYAYTPLTRKADHIAIRTADELYAKIPVHAAEFEAKLKAAGELDVNMTIVGSYEADRTALRSDELLGSCAQATHFITALTAGAFEFSAGAGAKVGGGAKLGGLGAGAESSAEREILNRDGFKSACEKATGSDKAPPDGCGALLRVEVVPLGDAQLPPAVAVEPRRGGNAGSVPPEMGGFVMPRGMEPIVGMQVPAREPKPSSTATTVGTIGVVGGSVGLTLWLVSGSVALVEKLRFNGKCPDKLCPPSEAGALSTYNTASTLATIGLIGGSVMLAGGIIAFVIPPPKKAGAGIRFDGTGVAGSF